MAGNSQLWPLTITGKSLFSTFLSIKWDEQFMLPQSHWVVVRLHKTLQMSRSILNYKIPQKRKLEENGMLGKHWTQSDKLSRETKGRVCHLLFQGCWTSFLVYKENLLQKQAPHIKASLIGSWYQADPHSISFTDLLHMQESKENHEPERDCSIREPCSLSRLKGSARHHGTECGGTVNGQGEWITEQEVGLQRVIYVH